MKGFAAWLHDLTTNDPYLVGLKTFATANAATWPYWSDKLDDYKTAIATAPAASQSDLLQGLVTAFERWTALQHAGSSKAGVNWGKIALLGFGLAFLAVLIVALFSQNFYESLARVDQVRGMVTFFFVLSTTGIIVLFSLSIFWLDSSEEVTKRFGAAKDVLTIVIGVLGTIMGFYFGTATGDSANMSIGGLVLSPPVIHAGQSTTLSARIGGGTKPYKYTIVFADPNNMLTQQQLAAMKASGDSNDGSISKSIAAPADVKSGTILFFTLTATDAKNVTAASSGALYVEPKQQ